MVVLDDADLELGLDGALCGAFGTSGQRGTSTSRLVVQRGIAGELVERLAEGARALRLGDPLDPTTDVGPVITAESASRIVAMVDGAVGEGAKAVTGGEVRTDVEGCEGGTFVEPTILTEAQRGHRVEIGRAHV